MKKLQNRKARNLVLNRQVIRELLDTELYAAGGVTVSGDPRACVTMDGTCTGQSVVFGCV